MWTTLNIIYLHRWAAGCSPQDRNRSHSQSKRLLEFPRLVPFPFWFGSWLSETIDVTSGSAELLKPEVVISGFFNIVSVSMSSSTRVVNESILFQIEVLFAKVTDNDEVKPSISTVQNNLRWCGQWQYQYILATVSVSRFGEVFNLKVRWWFQQLARFLCEHRSCVVWFRTNRTLNRQTKPEHSRTAKMTSCNEIKDRVVYTGDVYRYGKIN